MAVFAIYFTYADLNNGKSSTLEDFHSRLAALPKVALLRLCSVLNAMLRSDDQPINEAAHDGLVRAFFAPEIANRILQRVKGEPVRFAFHRQQTLFVAKEALLHSSDDEAATMNSADIGEVFLMANDHMHTESARQPQTDEEKFIRMAVHLAPVQEAAADRVRHKMLRSYLMTSSLGETLRGEQPFFDLPVLFEQATGIPLPTYYALLLAAVTRFVNFKPEEYLKDPMSYTLQEQWYASTKVAPEVVRSFLQRVSAAPSEYIELLKASRGATDFTAFRERPLLKIQDKLHLVDLALLAEKFEAGPFWLVLRHLPKEQQALLQSFWGKTFEQYIATLLRKSVDGHINVCAVSPRFQNNNEELCDVLIIGKRDLVLIESKSTTFTAQAKYEGDDQRLREEVESRLVRSADRPQAVMQLARNIENAFGRTAVALQGMNLRFVRTVYPVIVTRDDFGGVVGVNAYLDARFRAFLDRSHLSVSVAPLVCLSSENLEAISAYLCDTGFAEILSAHISANRKGFSRAIVSPFFTVPNSVLDRKGERRIPIQDEGWEQLMKLCTDQLGLEPPAQ